MNKNMLNIKYFLYLCSRYAIGNFNLKIICV